MLWQGESMDCPKLPKSKHWFISDDGSFKVAPLLIEDDESNKKQFEKVKKCLEEYKWKEGDAMLTVHCKNGTHYMWEVISMLIRSSADYLTLSKNVCQVDFCPMSEIDTVFPSPRVLNTHLRIDLLPEEFRKQKIVWGLRNPKDAATSFYHQIIRMGPIAPNSEMFQVLSKMTFSEFLSVFLFSKDIIFGNYFDYVDYMWKQKDQPNILLVFYEDLKRKPEETIKQIDEFLGTHRSLELIKQIAEASDFQSMKSGKVGSSKAGGIIEKYGGNVGGQDNPLDDIIYRRGEIGDWKKQFTVEDNELFNSVLEKWAIGKEIPFTYA
ncbi:sulfotransferase 6B1-like isoform X1 [Watersipora subatra]|uniref:sulfotransferase 6B1-like isoform X1 n=1 Tax=Watersipora subatra TaxID=2589382 RepID=UPI00355C4D07